MKDLFYASGIFSLLFSLLWLYLGIKGLKTGETLGPYLIRVNKEKNPSFFRIAVTFDFFAFCIFVILGICILSYFL
ncbi:MAG: hypothetical protein KAW45_07065 [Thermoplasmatales archaeon]|nr:hypothetical protein [Thermoplasmatales archaeon]